MSDPRRWGEAWQDAAWRLQDRLAQIERQVRELASRLDHCDDSVSVQEVRPIGRELRAIIDPSDGEG